MVRILGAPLQEEKGRVVAGGAAPLTHQGVGKPADGHLHGVVLSFGTLQLGDESLDAELLPATLHAAQPVAPLSSRPARNPATGNADRSSIGAGG